MPPKLLAGVFWVFLGGTLLSLAFDGESTSLSSGASGLTDLALIRSFHFEVGTGSIPIIGGLIDNVLDLNITFDVPYPPLDVWGGLMKQILLWEYDYLMSGPLEYLRYLLMLISVGVVAALIDLGIRILNVLANLVPFT